MSSNPATSNQIPVTMKAVRMYEFGGPEVLKVEEHPVPTPRANEVLVQVRATSVSGWDISYRSGIVKPIPGRPPLPMPQQLGREAAGDVVALGSDVHHFQIGDKVVLMSNPACGHCHFCKQAFDNLCMNTSAPGQATFGTYAEYITIPATDLMKAPQHLSYEQLACIIWSYGAVFQMINSRAKLRAGECVLITGAGGGMGTASIQLAKYIGASPIIALSSSRDKGGRLLAAGADVVLNYKDEDIEQQIRKHTPGGLGADVVLDNVGGPMAKLGLNVAKISGRVVLAAIMGGVTIELNILQTFAKSLSVLGSRSSTRSEQEFMLRLASEGKISPMISEVLPLTEIVKATRLMESGKFAGKIVLTT